MFWKKWKKKEKFKAVNLKDNGFEININEDFTLIEWSSIEKLIGYKTDLLTIDKICLQIRFDKKSALITEEYTGWREFMIELLEQFPNINEKWEEIISKPAFERNETELYKRSENELKFKCSTCGEIHNELPALTFKTPFHYETLNNKDKAELTEISNDFCIIRHSDQTDRFIRTTLTLQINNACENLDYGIWVSLSEKNFDEYKSNFKKNLEEKIYFGMICNEIPGYEESTIGLHVNVNTRNGGIRPEITLHRNEHQLVFEWENGIPIQEAEKRVNWTIKNVG